MESFKFRIMPSMLNVPIDGDDMIGVYFSEGHTGGVVEVGKRKGFFPKMFVKFVGLSVGVVT